MDQSLAPHFFKYTNLVEQKELISALKHSSAEMRKQFAAIDEERGDDKYREDKWTIKELLLHIIDTERVFAYRALRFVREEKVVLSGFDQDEFMLNNKTNKRSLEGLLKEYDSVRASTLALFESFDQEDLEKKGRASGVVLSVSAIGFIISGHELHHLSVLRERYLK